ncbi:predicted protein [Nematostella vectensis]|uniref:Uncharacterized protein n=1 Tax=Nematostella vectensis TaxID=45351 RepID=A7T3G1_NEMVE|nr:predicted protein [Nematostella vectensis]|eukprot:XP_001621604.1 hypothetical protein NEMVEDRAFT_v1g221792 [Nematostella vectensis]
MITLQIIPTILFIEIFLQIAPTWCKEKQIRTPVEDMSLGQLDANLRRFYAEARKINEEMYSKKTLLGFRHAIERHLNQPHLSRSLKLSTDPRFKRSNEMLDAQLVQMKRNGLENTKHKPAIEDEDLKNLKTSKALSPDTPSQSPKKCVVPRGPALL